MNVQSQVANPPARIPDLSLAHPKDAAEDGAQQPALASGNPTSSYGCVEWFRYPELPPRRPSPDSP
jgi:hypothetical protein